MPPKRSQRSKKTRSRHRARPRRTKSRTFPSSRRQSGAGLLSWMRRFLGPGDEPDNFEGRLPAPVPYLGPPGDVSYTAMPQPPQMTMPPSAVQTLTPLPDAQVLTQTGPITAPRGSAKKAPLPAVTAVGGMRKNASRRYRKLHKETR